MTDFERCNIEGNAILKYGKEHQVLKCIEEMAEFGKELVKDLIGEGNREHIVEEYSDLLITLTEMQMIYGIGINGEVEQWMDEKLERLKKRMEEEAPIEHADNSALIDMAYEK